MSFLTTAFTQEKNCAEAPNVTQKISRQISTHFFIENHLEIREGYKDSRDFGLRRCFMLKINFYRLQMKQKSRLLLLATDFQKGYAFKQKNY
jgi:hypothetical protein